MPPAQVEAFKTEMDNAKADYMFVSYPGVKHTFTNREADSYAAQFGLPLKYDNAADTDSWTRTLEFLKSTLNHRWPTPAITTAISRTPAAASAFRKSARLIR